MYFVNPYPKSFIYVLHKIYVIPVTSLRSLLRFVNKDLRDMNYQPNKFYPVALMLATHGNEFASAVESRKGGVITKNKELTLDHLKEFTGKTYHLIAMLSSIFLTLLNICDESLIFVFY